MTLAVFVGVCAFFAPMRALLEHVAVSTKVAHGPAVKAAGLSLPRQIVATQALLEHIAVSTKVAHGPAAAKGFALPEPLVATRALLEHIAVSTKVAHGPALAAEPASAASTVSTKVAHGPALAAEPASAAPVDAWSADPVVLADRLSEGYAIPSLEELEDACVLVSEKLAVCAMPADDSCTIDEQFSELYGKPVYLCHK